MDKLFLKVVFYIVVIVFLVMLLGLALDLIKVFFQSDSSAFTRAFYDTVLVIVSAFIIIKLKDKVYERKNQ